MKDSKAVHVTVNDTQHNLTDRGAKIDKGYLEIGNGSNKDFSCRYNSKKDTLICTCKRTKRKESGYFSTSRQVYRSQRYTSAKSITDIGVGSVKTLPKKRIRRIYLQETNDRGVGSSDLISFIQRRTRDWSSGYYDRKKTSSKCVGGLMDVNTSVLDKKLSPIFQTKSGTTSPEGGSFEQCNNIVNHPLLQDEVIKSVQSMKVKKRETRKEHHSKFTEDKTNYAIQTNLTNVILPSANMVKSTKVTAVNGEKDFSSDSLVQHVHNLENPSSYNHSKTSLSLIENKLEREYRNFFSKKPKDFKPSPEVKPMQDLKSASLLRRRFEALRRGLGKKEDSKKDCAVIKSSHISLASKKDVSIVSDPPSLEARSYSHTKLFSPIASSLHHYKIKPNTVHKKIVSSKTEDSSHWSMDAVDSDYKDAKGMFKLWGKKFNLEEDYYKKPSPTNSSDATIKQKKKVELILPKEVFDKEKKGAKRFSFFKRKSKDKTKQPYKSKKGITAGRCEVGDGFIIKFGAANELPPEATFKQCEKISDEYDDILRKAWLKRFLTNKIDSHNSVQIRWNNDMYAASSSTVFELMECVYKNTGVVFRSKSEVRAGKSSYYRYPTQRLVNFMQQSVEAWMIYKMTTDNKIEAINIHHPKKQKTKNIEVSFSNQKWFIDRSKAFAQNTELVLHSNNLVEKSKAESSEYIMIDIPKDYFSETSSDNELQSHTSDEQVYKIVEYETVNSSSYLKKKRKNRKMDTGDHEVNDIHVTVSVKDDENNESKILETVIKKPTLYRDVVVQGSNVYLPKRCDVIGVGIITQRDMRDIKKPILKMREEITDDESTHTLPPQKKCELAESYLHDYYRHWTPLGIDLFSWCVSDFHLRGSSDNNSLNSFNNQGDGSKSCPNIYDDYQASTVVSSCATSSCSHCKAIEDEKKVEKKDDARHFKLFGKFRRKLTLEQQLPTARTVDGKRVLPKDSLEVFKRRKIYAASNKSNWGVNDDRSEPYSVPSIEDKGAQKTLSEGPKIMKPCCIAAEPKSKKACKKHVSLQDCDVMNEILQGQLTDKMVEGILSFKGAAGCDTCKKTEPEFPRRAYVIPTPPCEMPQHPCIESCTKKRNPPCSKKNSQSCNVPAPPVCPVSPHSPCQPKACPPSPPPCALVPPCLQAASRSPTRSPPRCTPPRSPLSSPRSKTPVTMSPPLHTKSPMLCPRSPTCNTPPCSRPKPIPPRHYSPQRFLKPCTCPKKTSTCGLPQCPSINKTTACIHEPASSSCPPSPSCEASVTKPPFVEESKKNSSHKFPWPLKNQHSKSPSPKDSGMSLKMSPKGSISLSPSKCTTAFKNLIQKFSNSSMKNKECRPDCANRAKVTKGFGPPPPPPTAKLVSSVNTKSQPKMTGVHLKKMPQNSSNECESLCDEGIIKLNSKENIIIKRKKLTPSTEEIRHGCNIKVQDEDGQTLYERRDYKKAPDKTKKHFVREMYRGSQIQRVSTSNTDMIKHLKCESKNNSLSNIIEISLNFKFKQGDNMTEFNVKNCDNTPKEIQNEDVIDHHETSKNVYIVQDEAKPSLEETEKRDVNIKIVIKSYQQNPNTSKCATKNCVNYAVDDDFSRKISEKFHTVSTGYSDVLEQQTYSVQTTKINLVNSSDICKPPIKTSDELVNEELIEQEPLNLTTSESVTKCSALEFSLMTACANDDKLLLNDISQNKVNLDNKMETNGDKSVTGVSTSENDEIFNSVDQHSGTKVNKISNKEQKKKILKQIFENANNTRKNPNKSKMQSIGQMLRAVLTSDSSGYEDVPVDNELAKELTYASLKPNFFKDSNSMTNYYKLDDSISIKTSSENKFDEVLYPSEQNNSEDSDDPNRNYNEECLCSHVAAKLKIRENNSFRACCCRGVDKKDKEIFCNRTDEDISIINQTTYIDAQTQDSKYVSRQLKTSIVTISSKTVPKTSQEVIDEKTPKIITKLPKKMFSYSSNVKVYPLKKINRQTILGLSKDDKVIILHSNSGKPQSKVNEICQKIKPLDILQLYETKKAVLEIYAEKTLSAEGERMVAKLPKFVYNKETARAEYHESINGFSRRNISS